MRSQSVTKRGCVVKDGYGGAVLPWCLHCGRLWYRIRALSVMPAAVARSPGGSSELSARARASTSSNVQPSQAARTWIPHGATRSHCTATSLGGEAGSDSLRDHFTHTHTDARSKRVHARARTHAHTHARTHTHTPARTHRSVGSQQRVPGSGRRRGRRRCGRLRHHPHKHGVSAHTHTQASQLGTRRVHAP